MFWNESKNGITGYPVTDVITEYKQYKTAPYHREGIDPRFYAHDRMRVNQVIIQTHKKQDSQQFSGSGKVDERFNTEMPFRDWDNELYYKKVLVDKEDMYRESVRRTDERVQDFEVQELRRRAVNEVLLKIEDIEKLISHAPMNSNRRFHLLIERNELTYTLKLL